MSTTATAVSRILASAGLPKRLRSGSFGFEATDDIEYGEASNGRLTKTHTGTVSVHWAADNHEAGLAKVTEILTGKGFSVARDERYPQTIVVAR